jgi:hypothetical protein
MILNKRMQLILIVAMVTLIGCGGGGSSSTPATGASLAKSVGTYNDSAVSGVSYTCGTETGVTDINGTFKYDIGATCTFSLNDIILSIVSTQLSEANATILVNDIAIAQFLQSIDLDGNASNGITITPEIITVLTDTNVTEANNTSNLAAIVTALQTAISDYNGTEVNATEAEAHVEETRRELDHTAPVITLVGSNPLSVNQYSAFVAPIPSVVDDFYDVADINISIIANTVNTAIPGSYVVTYQAIDGAGNTSTLNLNVVVVDVTAPVITLVGGDVSLEIGTVYNELGATATDNTDGDISANVTISGTVNVNVAGSYTVTYNVSDTTGNNAVAITRTVTITPDATIPTISLNGGDISLELGNTYTDAGATATDNIDGDITANISVSNTVNINVVGTYIVIYNVSDAAGNQAASVTRIVTVTPDVTVPVLTLNGSDVTIELGTTYTEEGANAIDNIDGDISANIVVGGDIVDTNIAATYTVTYNVNDSAGNAAMQVTRTVTVSADVTIPVIALVGTNISIEQGSNYVDEGATALDNIDGDITGSIIVSGDTVDTNVVGTYTVRYNVSDSVGNAAIEVTRTVTITIDVTPPTIVLNGGNVSLIAGTSYVEEGATATDNVDTNLTASIVISGTVDTNIEGNYTVRYNVSDSAGNVASEVTRNVEVIVNTLAFVLPNNYYTDVIFETYNNSFYVEKFNFSADQQFSTAQLLLVNGVFIADTSNSAPSSYILDNGAWIVENSTYPFTLSGNAQEATINNVHRLTITDVVDISGNVLSIPGTDANVTMPTGAKRTTMLHEIIGDVYGVDEQAQTYGNTANPYYLTLSEVIQYQCGNRWFTDAKQGSGIQGISFTCGEENLTTGTLVGVGFDNTTLTPNVGTWTIITLPASTDKAIIVTINPAYHADTDFPLFAEKNGEIWRGWNEVNGTTENIALYNQVAFDAIETKASELDALANGTLVTDLASIVTGSTFYMTSYTGSVESLAFTSNATVTHSSDVNGTLQQLIYAYDVNLTTLNIYNVPNEGNLTFTNARQFATYIVFYDDFGTESGKFFLTEADALASLPTVDPLLSATVTLSGNTLTAVFNQNMTTEYSTTGDYIPLSSYWLDPTTFVIEFDSYTPGGTITLFAGPNSFMSVNNTIMASDIIFNF